MNPRDDMRMTRHAFYQSIHDRDFLDVIAPCIFRYNIYITLQHVIAYIRRFPGKERVNGTPLYPICWRLSGPLAKLTHRYIPQNTSKHESFEITQFIA